MKVIVFDLGGTLMEYEGMPNSWVDFYEPAFYLVNRNLNLNLSKEEIKQACSILTSFNPRISHREIEYSPEMIFSKATSHWNKNLDMNIIIDEFFKSIELKVNIFKNTLSCINELRERGYLIAILTDLPTAMPDEFIKKDITEILESIDLYVSSEICGYRKPNKFGLEYIAGYFKVEMEDVLFIGDESKDIITAINANCKSVLINRKGRNCDFGQNFTITDLSELHDLLAYRSFQT